MSDPFGQAGTIFLKIGKWYLPFLRKYRNCMDKQNKTE